MLWSPPFLDSSGNNGDIRQSSCSLVTWDSTSIMAVTHVSCVEVSKAWCHGSLQIELHLVGNVCCVHQVAKEENVQEQHTGWNVRIIIPQIHSSELIYPLSLNPYLVPGISSFCQWMVEIFAIKKHHRWNCLSYSISTCYNSNQAFLTRLAISSFSWASLRDYNYLESWNWMAHHSRLHYNNLSRISKQIIFIKNILK